MLDLMEKFFAGGKNWVRGTLSDAKGRRCMVGAIEYLRDKHHMSHDRTVHYLYRGIGEYYASGGIECPRFLFPIFAPQNLSVDRELARVVGFNDRCRGYKRGYKDVQLIIRRARELARGAARSNPARHARRFGDTEGGEGGRRRPGVP
jgi:hypothetical protein